MKIKIFIGLNVEKNTVIEQKYVLGSFLDYEEIFMFENSVVLCRFPETHRHPSTVWKPIFLKQKEASLTKNTDLVIITHSTHVIDYMGDEIIRKELNHNDVEINIMNIPSNRVVKKAGFDNEGYLVDFPPGFLSYKNPISCMIEQAEKILINKN